MQAELHLLSDEPAHAPSISSKTLDFIDYIDAARIPLHLATGPSYAVETDSEETEDWFSDVLLREAVGGTSIDSDPDFSATQAAMPWYETPQLQSSVGVLVKVFAKPGQSVYPRITELLFYASKRVDLAIAKLPVSARDSLHLELPDNRREGERPGTEGPANPVNLFALPLSSDLLYESSRVLTTSPIKEGEARFLLPSDRVRTGEPSPRKQNNLDGIFDEAANRRKRARGQGGRSISLAASRGLISPTTPQLRIADSRDLKGVEACRSQSPSCNLSLPETTITNESDRALLSMTLTSSLYSETSNEVHNKQAISRIVMAGMRMHGLQQCKASGKNIAARNAKRPSQADMHDESGNPEFKEVYHQTYKGTLFVFVGLIILY